MYKTNAARAILAMIATFSLPLQSSAMQIVNDPYCHNTDSPTKQLVEAVAVSQHRATHKIGSAVVATYQAYLVCADAYKYHGDLQMYVYAIAQSSDLYQFAARNYNALGEDDQAVAVLRFGHKVLQSTLKTGAGDQRFRDQIRRNQGEIDDLLHKLGS